ncbi:MAG: hypothetical protein MRECE_30c009 [Mycoplasmataceae bacterium CE_OT135]|nr:MAG: hypothetical protein MRECE_30c009 [Mycoplasmataceae bacterium CE_OT135]
MKDKVRTPAGSKTKPLKVKKNCSLSSVLCLYQ